MELRLYNIVFEYFLKNNLESLLIPLDLLNIKYIDWKNKNYTYCSSCKILIKKQIKCQICDCRYYCLSCFEDYINYCFYCNKTHCFVCNVKRNACKLCY